MRSQKLLIGMTLGLILLFSIFLSGCLSMQFDITPPPDVALTGQVNETPLATQAATQTSPPPTISQDAEGFEGEVIVVDVIDQTDGLLLGQGLEVRLDGYDQFELVYSDTKPLTTDNRLVFENVPLQAGRVFFASITDDGVIYRSDFVEAGDQTTSLQMAIQIFETTTSDEAILIERIHVLVDFLTPDLVQIVEIYIVSNLGDATFVAENPGQTTVTFPLPPGAESITFDDGVLGERYIKTEDGFGDTVSISPGTGVYQTLVYYTLPIKGNSFDFSQVMSYPVRAAVIMMPAGEVVEGPNLQDMGIQAIAEGSFQVYSASSIPRDESLQFRVSIKARSSGIPDNTMVDLSQGVIITAGVLGGLLLLTGVFLFIRQRRRTQGEIDFEEIIDERDEILDSIIALEDLYHEGDIAEKAYIKKRQELKDRLDSLADL